MNSILKANRPPRTTFELMFQPFLDLPCPQASPSPSARPMGNLHAMKANFTQIFVSLRPISYIFFVSCFWGHAVFYFLKIG